jgi:hypothetical protein
MAQRESLRLVGRWMRDMSHGSPRRGFAAGNPLETAVEFHLAGTEAKVRRPELELRRAELTEPWGRWPAGTQGFMVDAFEDEAVLEVMDQHGATLDMLSAPYSILVLHERSEQTHLPVWSHLREVG